MSDFTTLGEIVKKAKETLTAKAWDALTGGAEAENTLRRNRLSLDSLAFRPRILRDMRQIDLGRTFFGQRLRIPVAMAPIGSLADFHPEGAVAVARAAEKFGTMQFLSSASLKNHPIEQVRSAASHPMVFQLYVRGDDDWVIAQLRKAIDLGFFALCMTLDSTVAAQRERELSHGYDRRKARTISDGGDAPLAVTWELIKRIRDTFTQPLILKGLATAEDATLAVEYGADAVYVSNHGGRAMDHGRGAIDILPEVVNAVGRKTKILIDGGFFRGTDVIKALALGADIVCMGKMQGWSLGAGGTDGVVRMLEIIETEMKTNMILLGANNLDALGPSALQSAPPVTAPTVASAFPVYDISLNRT